MNHASSKTKFTSNESVALTNYKWCITFVLVNLGALVSTIIFYKIIPKESVKYEAKFNHKIGHL